jgi:ubiquinone/menaquinone biosynthesis C-methylase UbiE
MKSSIPAPQTISQLMWAHTATSVLGASVELDLYSAIASGAHSADKIAERSQCSQRGTKALLDALAGFGLLKKEAGEYHLTPESETFLVRNSPFFLGPLLDLMREMSRGYAALPEVVRTGKSLAAVDQESQGAEFFARLVKGLFPLNYPAGRFVAENRLVGTVKDVLDVAVGSGAWSIPLAELDQNVHVTGLDFKDVLPVTRRFFENRGVGNQFTELPGNLRDLDFGSEKYDLVILGHILHSEGEASSRLLLRKCYGALKKGGRVLIAEFMPNDDRTGPPQPLIFTVTMLLQTTEGTTYTLPELRSMLEAAGFSSLQTFDAPAASPLVVADK